MDPVQALIRLRERLGQPHLVEVTVWKTEVARETREIRKHHGRAAELLAQHRPKLDQMRTSYELHLRACLAKLDIVDDLELSTHLEQGDIEQIKVQPRAWRLAGT